jgi:phage shock protein E
MRLLIFIASIFMLFSCNSTSEAQKEEIIVDVRTVEEWNLDGHADCSVNYPLDQFESKIEELKNYKNVILVCRSGNRAEQAKEMLESAGYTNAENKGSWQNITCTK